MLRYLKLYAYFLRFSFSRAMEFRLDFSFRIVMDTAFYIVQIAFFSLLYRHTEHLTGWNFDQVLVFVAGYFVLDGLWMALFSTNMWWLPLFVNRGDLDYYLVRPVSSLFFLSLREFAANSFMNMVIAIGILIWALARYPEPLGAGSIICYIALLINGTFLMYIVNMWFLIPVFWLQDERGLGTLFFTVSSYVGRPHRIFRGWLRRVMMTILPFGMMASFPAVVLFDGLTLLKLLHVTSVTVACFVVLVLFWRKGLRSYASASS
ncbi:ABC transporter permease [Planctomycetota bacterium]